MPLFVLIFSTLQESCLTTASENAFSGFGESCVELHGGGRYEFFSDLQLYCKQNSNVKDRFSRLLILDRGFNSTNLSRLYNAVGTVQPQLALDYKLLFSPWRTCLSSTNYFLFFTH